MAKATTTIKQILNYRPEHGMWFAANAALFNRVASFCFEVIQAHEKILGLPNKEALTALEKLTHTTQSNPHPVMPLEDVAEDIPATFEIREGDVRDKISACHQDGNILREE